MTFAEKVKKLRKALGVSQVKLAKLLSVSQGSVACWETSISECREPARLKLEKLSTKKGLRINWRN